MIKNGKIKGRILYIALGITVLAAGVAGYFINNSYEPYETEEKMSSEMKFTNINEPIFTKPPVREYQVEKVEPQTEESTEISTEAVFDNSAEKIEEEKKNFFRVPVSGGMGKDFSMGIPVFSKTMKDYRTHNGVDFCGIEGEDIAAIGEGRVIQVEKSPLWGNSVTIDHGNGIISVTKGLGDERLIAVDTAVNTGSIIGIMGTVPVEKEEAPHIHLEIRKDGVLSDPMEFFGAD